MAPAKARVASRLSLHRHAAPSQTSLSRSTLIRRDTIMTFHSSSVEPPMNQPSEQTPRGHPPFQLRAAQSTAFTLSHFLRQSMHFGLPTPLREPVESNEVVGWLRVVGEGLRHSFQKSRRLADLASDAPTVDWVSRVSGHCGQAGSLKASRLFCEAE